MRTWGESLHSTVAFSISSTGVLLILYRTMAAARSPFDVNTGCPGGVRAAKLWLLFLIFSWNCAISGAGTGSSLTYFTWSTPAIYFRKLADRASLLPPPQSLDFCDV